MAKRGFLNLILLTALLIVIISIQPAFGFEEAEDEYDDYTLRLLEESDTSVNFFYSSSCGACNAILPMVYDLSASYPNITFNIFDIYGSEKNRMLMLAFGDRYGIDYPAYPVVFTGDITVLQGKTEISRSLEYILEAHRNGDIPDFEYETSLRTTPKLTTPAVSSTISADDKNLSFLLVIFAGLIDGINPCALSVLALLLVALSNLKPRRRIIFGGLVYASAVFLFYILAGLGIMTIVDYTGILAVFSIAAGIVALAAGIISFADGIFQKGIVSPAIPDSGKNKIKKIMEKISIPTAFILGVLVGIFELPCTGGVYIAILGLLSSEMTFYEGLPYLVVYNLMFVLPLIAIIFAVGFGLPPERVNEWREKNKKILKTGIGLVLIAIGLYILAGYIFIN